MAKKKKTLAKGAVVELPKKVKKQAEPVSDEQHLDVIEELRLHCVCLEYEIGWFPRARQASVQAKAKMTEAVSGKSKGYSITKRLFSSSHDAVKELNSRRAAIDAWRDSFAIVMAGKPRKRFDDLKGDAEVEDETPEPTEEVKDTGAKGAERIARGMRLIRVKDVIKFAEGFNERVASLLAQAAVVQEALPMIKEFDKEQLGDDFRDDDYPENIVSLITISGPTFTQVDISPKLPPIIFEQQLADVNAQLNATVEKACAYVGNTLVKKFGDLAEQLVNRQRVHPKKGSGLERFENAELLQVGQPAGGRVAITLRYEIEVENPTNKEYTKLKKVTESVELDEDSWHDELRPVATPEKHKIFSSTVDQLLGWLNNFSTTKGMLGAYGDQMEKQLEEVRTLMSNLTRISPDKTAEGIAGVLRDGDLYRADLANKLTDAIAGIEAVSVEATVVRRRINPAYVGKGSKKKESKE